MATTLATIKTRARQLADMESSNFIADSELTYMVNASYMELYDLVLDAYEDHYLTSATSTVSSGNTIALPSDFYKLRGVDMLVGSDYVNVYPYSWENRNRNTRVNRGFADRADVRYRLTGSTLRFEPSDNALGTYRYWYVPAVTALSAAGDNIDSFLTRMGWEEYIAIDCAIKMKEKEESSTSGLERMKGRIRDRIVSAAANRDAGGAAIGVSDTRTGDPWNE